MSQDVPMSDYDTDILIWSEHQAELLPSRPCPRRWTVSHRCLCLMCARSRRTSC
jgi:hypothetical protein